MADEHEITSSEDKARKAEQVTKAMDEDGPGTAGPGAPETVEPRTGRPGKAGHGPPGPGGSGPEAIKEDDR